MRRELLVIRAAGVLATIDDARIPLGRAEEVRAALAATLGDGTWQDPSEGLVDGPGFSVLAKIGIFPLVDTMTLEIWGNEDPLHHIDVLCSAQGWQAFERESGRQIAP